MLHSESILSNNSFPKKKLTAWARPGFEPGTSRTLSENHTPRPTSQVVKGGTTTITYSMKFSKGRQKVRAPGWARTTNLSVNSRTR